MLPRYYGIDGILFAILYEILFSSNPENILAFVLGDSV